MAARDRVKTRCIAASLAASLGDVVRDRQSRPPKLITESRVAARHVLDEDCAVREESNRALIDVEALESEHVCMST
jgi:hypothetical protein